jgi:hypothetical protein
MTLFIWFAPSYNWDDFVGTEVENLGNEIFGLLRNSLTKDMTTKLRVKLLFTAPSQFFG